MSLFSASFTDYNVQVTNEDTDSIKEKIISGEAECAFVMTNATEYKYYVNNLGIYDMNTEIANEVLKSVYQMNAMVGSGMTAEQAGEVMNIQITGEAEALGKDEVQNFGQMVATNGASEKSSRAMEVLITSAKPLNMMFGKVLASCFAGLLQLVAVFGSAVLFYNINKPYLEGNMIVDSIFNIPTEILVYMLVFFLLGFLIYAFMYAAIASTVSKLEDINTSVQPVTILFIIGFFVVIFSMTGAGIDNGLMKVCSYIPFTSPMAMFTRIAMSTVPWYEIAASIAILIGSVIGVGIISAKIYRVGVLLYGTTPKIGTILKSIWKA